MPQGEHRALRSEPVLRNRLCPPRDWQCPGQGVKLSSSHSVWPWSAHYLWDYQLHHGTNEEDIYASGFVRINEAMWNGRSWSLQRPCKGWKLLASRSFWVLDFFLFKKKKKKGSSLLLYQYYKKGEQNGVFSNSTTRTKLLFITWWILFQTLWGKMRNLESSNCPSEVTGVSKLEWWYFHLDCLFINHVWRRSTNGSKWRPWWVSHTNFLCILCIINCAGHTRAISGCISVVTWSRAHATGRYWAHSKNTGII